MYLVTLSTGHVSNITKTLADTPNNTLWTQLAEMLATAY